MNKERKSKEFPCIETTIDFLLEDLFVIRIWMDKDKLPEDYSYELELIDKIKEKLKGDDFDFENAKGVKLGTVVYTVPFNEQDTHG